MTRMGEVGYLRNWAEGFINCVKVYLNTYSELKKKEIENKRK